jgi:cbb3-type cytochrome oxidase maturation protein
MSVIFILVFVAIAIALAFLIAFIWAVKSGQYEDTYTPSVRILFDDFLSVKGETGKVKENKNEINKSLSKREE